MKGIVVGVDGSPGSKRALDWAAAEARLRGVPLKLVSAWHIPVGLYGGMGWAGIDSEVIGGLGELAEERLQKACEDASALLEGLEVERVVVEGLAAARLIEAASEAELLVVGTRGHGGFTGLLLGSVSQECAHHSPCPIVIVPHGSEKR